ncbi:MAG: 4Fe-4S dicluster domain-containing protein [Desulfovibrionaceae bacterium]
MDQKVLRELEARCIQEEPPRCAAACPLHVDARTFCMFMADGRWNEAWAVLARTIPLPGVLARICDAPCEAACLRSEAGGAVRLGALERFCANKADRTPKVLPLPAKSKRAAVFGAGLAGLCAAWELARKGFDTTLYGDQPAGLLARMSEAELPKAALAGEMERLRKLGVSIEPDADLSSERLRELAGQFDTAFVDAEMYPLESIGLGQPDELSLGTELPGLFAGPPLADLSGPVSPVGLALMGRRAANSMERFVQGVSLVASREKEGPFETRLFTSLEGVQAALPVEPDREGYTEEQARAEAGRCLRCECLECVKNCAFLKQYGSYPKVYARRIYNNESIVMGTRHANEMIDSCMLCGLCTALCPEDFDMAGLCLEARNGMVRRGKMPATAFEFALRDMAFANGDKCALVKGPPSGAKTGLLFFPGCQLTASDPDGVRRAYAWLLQHRSDTGLHLACCAAPALWAGRAGEYAQCVERLRTQWAQLGEPDVVAACPTCLKTLAQALPGARLRSFWGLARELGLPDGARLSEETLAVHDPCGSREDAALHEDVRGLLADLGVRAVEPGRLTRELTECCGFGGLMANANPPLAERVAEQRVAITDKDFVTYCAMCRDRLARTGKPIRHLFDLLFPEGREHAATRPAPGHSERRENRARLRVRLLKEFWGEDSTGPEAFEGVVLSYAPGVAERLEERRILKSDLQKTLLAAGQQGGMFVSEAGHLLTCHRPVSVTYWVEYEADGQGGWLVHNAWSHRMRVAGIEGGGR